MFRSFSYNNFRKYKINNGKLSLKNELPSFFDITSNKLIEELEQEITFNSDLNNKSYDFLQKYSLNSNDTNINNHINNKNSNLYNDIDNIRNNCWNSYINSNNYFQSENKDNEQNKFFSKTDKENIFNNISKTNPQFNYNGLIMENSHFSYKNKYINNSENNKERKNINENNILITEKDRIIHFNENIVEFQDGYKFNSVQNIAKGDLNDSKILHQNKINSIVKTQKKFYGFQESNTNQNNDIYNTINNNININNNKIYYNNNINMIYNIIPNNQKDEALQLNEKNILFSANSMTNNNNRYIEYVWRQHLNPNDYLIEMYGRLGWICYICDNFNYETRKKCNRCKAIKLPKIKDEICVKRKKIKKEKNIPQDWKLDWICLNCKNLNYGFRKFCNRCKIKKQKVFPSIFLKPSQKLKGKEVI